MRWHRWYVRMSYVLPTARHFNCQGGQFTHYWTFRNANGDLLVARKCRRIRLPVPFGSFKSLVRLSLCIMLASVLGVGNNQAWNSRRLLLA
jgi:hypothetical protein